MAFEWYKKAAELGYAEAHHNLSVMYHYGHSVEKDKGRQMYHAEEAAIGGYPDARYFLGCEEWDNGNTERAVKHWIIAAMQGEDDSIKAKGVSRGKAPEEAVILGGNHRQHE